MAEQVNSAFFFENILEKLRISNARKKCIIFVWTFKQMTEEVYQF